MKIQNLLFATIFVLAPAVKASPVPTHLGDSKKVLERLDTVSGFDFSRVVTKTPLATILTEPMIRVLWATQIFTKADWIGIQGLASIHHRIDPGGSTGDASNIFLYTCKGGWLDMGHVINTALSYKVFYQALGGGTLLRPTAGFMLTPEESKKFHHVSNQFMVGSQAATAGNINGDRAFWAGFFAMRSGYWIEERQTKTKKQSSSGKYDSNATSAYTLEDLPSDYYGILIAERMERRNYVGGVVNSFKREIAQLMKDFRSVSLKNKLVDRSCGDTAEEVLKKDAAYYEHQAATKPVPSNTNVSSDPRSVYNFTVTPKKTLRHACVCNSKGNPIGGN